MTQLNVRIEDLPPMRVARVRAVSEHPETDAPSEDGIETRDVPGGRYAVLTHYGLPDPQSWRRLWDWVQASPHAWRENHELERPHDPLAPPDKMVFDLMLPIASAHQESA